MSVYISIHDVARVKADSFGISGAPLTLDLEDRDLGRRGEVVIYVGDHALSRRLADAINNAVREHREETAGANAAEAKKCPRCHVAAIDIDGSCACCGLNAA